ncbi:MAG: Ig-like domain-containing protein [Bacilli bacterium]|nr:Ig-like domain-containing protein [Bacilli bacterium]
MKKKYIPLVLALSCMLAACGDENGASSNVQNSTPISSVAAEKHTVTYAESADYTVTGLVEGGYAEGETVSFKITVNNAAKEIDDVVVNRQALTPAADGTYSFTMGDSNVTINITLKDKANAKTATIEVSNATPEAGDTITVTLKLDGTALTSGVTVTATKGADLVEITGTSVKCKTAGAVTLKAEATVEGIPYSKTIDVTIAAGVQVITIKALQDTAATYDSKGNANYANKVAVEGRVVNMNYNGPVIYDGTALIQCYDKKFDEDYASLNLAVGDYVRVTGTPTRYKKAEDDVRWWQFTCFDSTAKKVVVGISKIQHAEIALPTVADSDFTATEFGAYTTPAASTVKLVTFTGKANVDGTHVNIALPKGDGTYTTDTISYYNSGTELVTGASYTMTAFLAEKQQGKYLVAYVLNDTIVRNYETATSVTISGPTTLLLANTAGIQLSAVVSPELANQEVVWSSETPSIAAVSATGLVTPVAAGTATIKATQKGGTAYGTYTVRVLTEAIAATSIELDKTEESVAVGGTVTLTPTVAPANSTDLVEWSTSNAAVATVEDGVVTGVAAGTATITAKAGDKTATCAITVTDPYGTVESPISVSELIALADEVIPNQSTYSDKKVVVTGKMANNATLISGKTNYQFTIADMDDSSKTFPVYACDIDAQIGIPTAGNFVVVTGYLNNFRGTKQISYKDSENPTLLSRENGTANLTVSAEHATVTGIPATAENGTEVSFTVAVDDEYVLDSVKLGTTELTAVEGTYSFTVAGDATITVVTHKEGEAASVTVTKTSNQIVADKQLTVSTNGSEVMYTSLELDSVITVSTTGEPNCGSFWGTTTIDWRLYQAKGGNMVLTAAEGYQLVSATFVYNVSNNGVLKHGDNNAESGATVALSGSSETFVVGNTGTKTNGQVRIISFSVTYIAA